MPEQGDLLAQRGIVFECPVATHIQPWGIFRSIPEQEF
jgi:hypothetical protein